MSGFVELADSSQMRPVQGSDKKEDQAADRVLALKQQQTKLKLMEGDNVQETVGAPLGPFAAMERFLASYKKEWPTMRRDTARISWWYIRKDALLLTLGTLMTFVALSMTFWAPAWFNVTTRLVFSNQSGAVSLSMYILWLFLYVLAVATMWALAGALLFVMQENFAQRLKWHVTIWAIRSFERDESGRPLGSHIVDVEDLEHQDVHKAAAFWFQTVPVVIAGALSIIASIVLIFAESWKVGLTGLGLFCVFALVSFLADHLALNQTKHKEATMRKENANWQILRAQNSQNDQRIEAGGAIILAAKEERAVTHGLRHVLVGTFYRLVTFCAPVVFFLVAGNSVLAGDMQQYQIILCAVYFAYAVMWTYFMNTAIVNGQPSLAATFRIMHFVSVTNPQVNPALLNDPAGQFDNQDIQKDNRIRQPWALMIVCAIFIVIAAALVKFMVTSNKSSPACKDLPYTCTLTVPSLRGYQMSMSGSVAQHFQLSGGCIMKDATPQSLMTDCASALVASSPPEMQVGQQQVTIEISFTDWTQTARGYQTLATVDFGLNATVNAPTSRRLLQSHFAGVQYPGYINATLFASYTTNDACDSGNFCSGQTNAAPYQTAPGAAGKATCLTLHDGTVQVTCDCSAAASATIPQGSWFECYGDCCPDLTYLGITPSPASTCTPGNNALLCPSECAALVLANCAYEVPCEPGICDCTSQAVIDALNSPTCTSAPTPVPTPSPVSSAPVAPPTSSPTTSPVTSPPTSSPVTSPPTSSPVTSPPTSSPVTPPPTVAPATSPPTSSPVTSPPTSSPVTPPPTLSPVTSPPTSSPVTPPPTSSPVVTPTTAPPSSHTSPIPTPCPAGFGSASTCYTAQQVTTQGCSTPAYGSFHLPFVFSGTTASTTCTLLSLGPTAQPFGPPLPASVNLNVAFTNAQGVVRSVPVSSVPTTLGGTAFTVTFPVPSLPTGTYSLAVGLSSASAVQTGSSSFRVIGLNTAIPPLSTILAGLQNIVTSLNNYLCAQAYYGSVVRACEQRAGYLALLSFTSAWDANAAAARSQNLVNAAWNSFRAANCPRGWRSPCSDQAQALLDARCRASRLTQGWPAVPTCDPSSPEVIAGGNTLVCDYVVTTNNPLQCAHVVFRRKQLVNILTSSLVQHQNVQVTAAAAVAGTPSSILTYRPGPGLNFIDGFHSHGGTCSWQHLAFYCMPADAQLPKVTIDFGAPTYADAFALNGFSGADQFKPSGPWFLEASFDGTTWTVVAQGTPAEWNTGDSNYGGQVQPSQIISIDRPDSYRYYRIEPNCGIPTSSQYSNILLVEQILFYQYQ